MIRFTLGLGVMVLLGSVALPFLARASDAMTLTHIHGLSFTTDGSNLLIPRHHGLAVYSQGKWSVAPGPQHDYMGFAVTREALYSSGHPAPGSPLRNPLGLAKSMDGGQTWKTLSLSGEADFHLMAASYQARAVYVFSPAPNSHMPQPGLYVTTDDGKHWQRAKATGVSGQVRSLAILPPRARWWRLGRPVACFCRAMQGRTFSPSCEVLRRWPSSLPSTVSTSG